MASKKYEVINEKYGAVGEMVTFSELKKNAKENSADEDLTEDTLNDGRAVVRDSHNVIVAEILPEGEKRALSGGVTNRNREESQEDQPKGE